MKVIIAGSRNLNPTHSQILAAFAKTDWSVSEIVSGTARGVDRAGEMFAKSKNIPVKQFPADWKRHGKVAGMIRNAQMADYADALLAFWDGESPGTRAMIAMMKGRKKPVHCETKK